MRNCDILPFLSGVSATINQTMSPASPEEDIGISSDDEQDIMAAHRLLQTQQQNLAQNQKNVAQSQQAGHQSSARYTRLSSASTSSASDRRAPVSENSADPANRLSVFSLSTATTDTILSPSNGDEPETNVVPTKANCNFFAHARKQNSASQGANPVAERNTHKCSDEQLAIMGNSLVDRRYENGVEEVQTLGRTYKMAPEPFETVAGRLETSLVQSDILSRQIEVAVAASNQREGDSLLEEHYNTEPTTVPFAEIGRPKMHNTSLSNIHGVNLNTSTKDVKHKKEHKPWKERFVAIFGRIHNPSKAFLDQESANVASTSEDSFPTENLCEPEPRIGVFRDSKASGFDSKSNLCPRTSLPPATTQITARQSEVRIMNGVPVVRPTSLAVSPRPTSYQPRPIPHHQQRPKSSSGSGIGGNGTVSNGTVGNGMVASGYSENVQRSERDKDMQPDILLPHHKEALWSTNVPDLVSSKGPNLNTVVQQAPQQAPNIDCDSTASMRKCTPPNSISLTQFGPSDHSVNPKMPLEFNC